MEVRVAACLVGEGGKEASLQVGEDGALTFQAPPQLLEAGYPVKAPQNFQFDEVYAGKAKPKLHDFAAAAAEGLGSGTNTVVVVYGESGTLGRRPFLFGEGPSSSSSKHNGLLQHCLTAVCKGKPGGHLTLSGCVFGAEDGLTDLLNPENGSAVLAESLKEGPHIENLAEEQVVEGSIGSLVQRVFETVEDEFATAEVDEAFPPYNPSHVLVSLKRYEKEGEAVEVNSLTLILLGDSERPPLCGIDRTQQVRYEQAHKIHSGFIGVLGSIKCNRLRVPFTKTKITALLRRAYNNEKNNPNNDKNGPTKSFMFTFVSPDSVRAEETYHSLVASKRVLNVMGGGGAGPASRDLGTEKWRLEQDILELRDELAIAKAVHDFRPYISDPNKEVQNIQQEEAKRIASINKKREEARSKAQAELRIQAQQEAQAIIDKEEKKANSTLKELEKALKEKTSENAKRAQEQEKLAKDYEKQLEKGKKKKQDEQEKAAKLKDDLLKLEQELNARNIVVAKAQKYLAELHEDHKKGRELILAAQKEGSDAGLEGFKARQKEREDWVRDIDATNHKILEQLKALAREQGNEESGEKLRKGIASITEFIPEMEGLEPIEIDNSASQQLAKNLADYYKDEEEKYKKKVAEENKRRQELEKAAELYRRRLTDHENKLRRDQLQEALKKEADTEGITKRIIGYAESGCRMVKVPSKGTAKKRFFFLSEDHKKIQSCEMDESGAPISRKKPSSSISMKDIKRVVLGQFSSAFDNFCKEKAVDKGNPSQELMDEDGGCYNPTPADSVTPANAHKFFYRSLTIELKKAKESKEKEGKDKEGKKKEGKDLGVDLILETDTDFEAWVVALKHLVGGSHVQWGAKMKVEHRQGFGRLSPEEGALCSEQHMTPTQFLTAKQGGTSEGTDTSPPYHLRSVSSLDLPRAIEVHAFLSRQ